MPRRVVAGLVQAAAPLSDPALPIDKVRQAAIDVHIRSCAGVRDHDAGPKGTRPTWHPRTPDRTQGGSFWTRRIGDA